ncbi:hypothetical protein GCM10011331_23960 [Flavimobilis marinus]|uniref:TIGR03083 family protein n=1 Tax=Flavimobilis marinus TaxID=285351 RepID=A0A1I2GJK5_9MICO|nr:maleylpyruvate isomerase family mycothiol-dependent enzyme [Flavimobilis marinus]GHG56414.1 hypothetical protein GCM10011331_23960 [Flavimobilis marinus]SFF17027.1 TIGR03083 family protein [Flavimobilis marinus]
MTPAANDVWPIVHAERRRLVADLLDLPIAQWRTPSLCPGWDVHDVLAHVVDTARTGRLMFVRELLRARFNFDRANDTGVAREKRTDPQDTVRTLDAVVSLTRTPPANLATRLVEAFVHGEDIRRPLGVAGTYPAGAVADALAYQLRTPVSFGGGRERAAGLRMVDSSTGQAWGEAGADVVEGAGIDLLLAVSGRPVPTERLTGRGAARLLDATG